MNKPPIRMAYPGVFPCYICPMLKRLVGLAICLVSVLGINLIPLELLLNHGFSSSGAMLLYLVENVTGIFISAAIVFLLGQRGGVKKALSPAVTANQAKPKQLFAGFSPLNTVILNFLAPAAFVTLVTGVFLVVFVFWILHTHMSAGVFWTSV